MSVFRIYVEKKQEFAVKASSLLLEIKEVLNIKKAESLRILNRYDVENIEKQIFDKATYSIFSEPLVDEVYFNLPDAEHVFAVEFLDGQYDKRADFCEQCLQLISCKERPTVKTAQIYILTGEITKKELKKIKEYIINPIECKEASLKDKKNLKKQYKTAKEVQTIHNFNDLNKLELENFIIDNNISISLKDALICQKYFKNEEKRPPTMTEIKILDAYWSDHCRHTTFNTEIENVSIKDKEILNCYNEYIKIRKKLKFNNKPITLMDIATIGAKKLKNDGLLKNLDESDEINACSVLIPMKIKDKIKDVALMFKNETHNHPTEIEPFGGAATCLGGAIRDPLSGRCFVYQAMRITGAANPLTPLEKTLKGKLPQRKIVKTSAAGYSSYGNEIGIATGFVEEIYHKGYLAKRMEIGAVIGTNLKENIVRKKPENGDVVLILGGKTGRDGCGGASGSSKSHTKTSLEQCAAQVQKGNPVEERKIQRLFKNPEITKIIKKCNDFGAGGVCVAIGELADGISINLDKIPKKYEGLNATELAISESQERMAVVVSKKDVEFFIKTASTENITATEVATITNEKRVVMYWNNKKVVDISRDFLNLNGAKRKTSVMVKKQNLQIGHVEENTKLNWLKHLEKLNICSEKGLVNMFDSTIGANTVLMPYGGKHGNTKAQSMVAIIPIKGNEKTVSIMSYGGNPFLEEQSPFYGSMYAVIESVSKIIATGGSIKNCWLTFQEYFPKIENDKKKFGVPFSALLGALKAQLKLKIAAIGGKDSMSGSFENLNVPPTLISFAISIANIKNIISPEFKKTNSKVALILPKYGKNKKPNFNSLLQIFSLIENLIASKKATSVFAIRIGGICEAISKMCFGNKIGFKFSEEINQNLMFNPSYGGFVVELKENVKCLKIIGQTIEKYEIQGNSFTIDLNELEKKYEKTLEPIYPTKIKEKEKILDEIKYKNNISKKSSLLIKTPTPKVLIPVFPGTNCEFDLKDKFEKEGALVSIFVINNMNENNIKKTIVNFAEKLKSSNIIALAGGFSASDEPDGAAKFITAFFKNPKIKEATQEFLKEKDGLMLGICNGFQALIKLGLIENGQISDINDIGATLTYNKIGIHQSFMSTIKIVSNKSPWLQYEKIGTIQKIAISHGEGRLITTKKTINSLIENEQIATVYCDLNGAATMENPQNPNGSFCSIEGLTSKDGRIFGRMGHSERMKSGLYKNVPNLNFQNIFKAGVSYFKWKLNF